MRRFGTFEGVFTPTLLSILGVIMYLRLGWVVGQVGLFSALVIIIVSNFITLATALSMSSIVTNIRIGTGGAYSIITKSLGIEAGGSIGIPLYISQALSVAFYITGFTECWISVFPAHSALLVSLVLWGLLLVVTYRSASLAFRMQYIIMAFIGLSLISIFLGGSRNPDVLPILSGMGTEGFWKVFAIFFPAVTGVLAGASMSGELKDPRRSIPLGTLAAVVLSFLIYISLAAWFALHVSAVDLVADTSIVIRLGHWGWLVTLGIMGATVSSALGMFVSSPRTLLALGKHSIIPYSHTFSETNHKGEPANAILLTAVLSLITILLGNLNALASLLTMFFLITYGMINFSVFIEQSIGIASFRPTFRISRVVSFAGGLGCLIMMLLIDFKFSLITFVVIGMIYTILIRREINVHSPDVRSGLLVFLSEQFAKLADRLPYHPKIWKPNLLVITNDWDKYQPAVEFIKDVAFPSGRLMFVQVKADMTPELARPGGEAFREGGACPLEASVQALKEEGFFVEGSVIESRDFFAASDIIIQMAKDMLFPPNTLFYYMPDGPEKDVVTLRILKKAAEAGLGLIILRPYTGEGRESGRVLNLWIRQHTPNINLAILIALKLMETRETRVRVILVVPEEKDVTEGYAYLSKLKKLMRLPLEVEMTVLIGIFAEIIRSAPPAKMNIFGMAESPDLKTIRRITDAVGSPVMFLRDSKHESVLA